MLKRFKSAVKAWYRGEFVTDPAYDDGSIVVIGGHHKRHWTAKLARAIIDFLSKEWKWVIGTIIAVCGLILAYFKLK